MKGRWPDHDDIIDAPLDKVELFAAVTLVTFGYGAMFAGALRWIGLI